MYPYLLSNVNQVSGSPESPNWLENQICYLPPFYPEIFNVAAKVEAFVYPIWNGCMNLTLPIFFLCFEKSKNLVVQENTATVFCHEATEIFSGLQSLGSS